MKRGIIVFLSGTLALLLVLSLFVSQLKSADQLMTPPNNRGEDAEVTEALQDFLGADYKKMTLKYPSEGNYRSAYIKRDLNRDGAEEVLVFYTLQSDATVRFNLLQEKKEKWVSIYDEAGYGNNILSVDFSDLNGDGQAEILLGWSPFDNSSAKTLSVHSFSEDGTTLDTLVNQTYSYMSPVDMDGDGLEEILLIKADTGEEAPEKASTENRTSGNPTAGTVAYAGLLKMNSSGTVSTVGTETKIDGSVSAYGNLSVQKKDGQTVAFLDAYKGTDAMVTEVLWWDAEQSRLVAPFTPKDSLTNAETFRTPAVPATDLDGDGYIDIPVMKGEPATASSEDTDVAVPISLTTWYNYEGPNATGLTVHAYGFADADNRYTYQIPIRMKGQLLAFRNKSTGMVTVYSTADGKTAGSPLFSLVTTNLAQLRKEEYTFHAEHKNVAVYGTLTGDAANIGFTDELIEKSIFFY